MVEEPATLPLIVSINFMHGLKICLFKENTQCETTNITDSFMINCLCSLFVKCDIKKVMGPKVGGIGLYFFTFFLARLRTPFLFFKIMLLFDICFISLLDTTQTLDDLQQVRLPAAVLTVLNLINKSCGISQVPNRP